MQIFHVSAPPSGLQLSFGKSSSDPGYFRGEFFMGIIILDSMC